jgi:actin-related protein
VCGNAIKTNKKKMADQLEAMWYYAQNIADEDEEDRDPESPDFKEMDPEKIKQTAAKINTILKGTDNASSKAKAKARYIEKTFSANLERYQAQEEILKNRGSYAKTDPDAPPASTRRAAGSRLQRVPTAGLKTKK